MVCPKCDNKELIVNKRERKTNIKFRVLTYNQENTICGNCKFEFFTPKQLDNNSASLKKAYLEMVN